MECSDIIVSIWGKYPTETRKANYQHLRKMKSKINTFEVKDAKIKKKNKEYKIKKIGIARKNVYTQTA